MHKICFYCGSKNLTKDGHSGGYQRVICKDCGKRFVDKKRLRSETLYKDYLVGKQSVKLLADRYGVSTRTILRYLDKAKLPSLKEAHKEVVLLMDATYRGKQFGVMVFKDAHTKQVLWYKFLNKKETIRDYLEGIDYIEQRYMILGGVCDGLKGLIKALDRYPIQYYQFYQVKTIRTYLTQHPESLAGKELLALTFMMKDTDKETLFSLPSSKGFALGTNGHLAMKGSPRVGGFCWVHSRVDNGTMLVSTQSLICNNDAVVQTYSGADRLREAARSFGANLLSEAFLKPNGTRSRIALEAFGITLNDVKGAVGTTTPNIVGFSLKDAVYFAGDKSPIYDKAVTQQIKLSLSTLEGLDEDNLKLSINGTECTAVAVGGDANTVVATIPASMDGEAIKSVAIGDNDKTFSIKMA